VHFKELDRDFINWYVGTGEPMDKAGAYGIQGYGAMLVDRIEGDFYNVMGFPVSRIMGELERLDIYKFGRG
jgi:septum formation protein